MNIKIIGDITVGKTAMFKMYKAKHFKTSVSTIGVDFINIPY